jgi:hypothetical protein
MKEPDLGKVGRATSARVRISIVVWGAAALIGLALAFTGQGSLHVVCANPSPGGVCNYPPSPIDVAGYALLAVALVGLLGTIGLVIARRRRSRDKLLSGQAPSDEA